jgi:hypothetical protein
VENNVSKTLLKALDNATSLYDRYKDMDVADIKSEIAILNTTATLAKTYIDNEKLERRIVNLIKYDNILIEEGK